MKENTQKILLMLYNAAEPGASSPQEKRSLPEESLCQLLPTLSPAGFKSLLFFLEKKEILVKHSLAPEPSYSLSSYGVSALEKQFPALSLASKQWRGQWTIILFLTAPKTDKNFRYLRNFLLDRSCIALNRGVFLYPGNLSELIKNELEKSYRQAVLALQVDHWAFGDEQLVIGQKIQLPDIFELYSGLSSELEQLIRIGGGEKALNDTYKAQFTSIFDRFLAALSKDSGLLSHYYPQVNDAQKLLLSLQKAWKI